MAEGYRKLEENSPLFMSFAVDLSVFSSDERYVWIIPQEPLAFSCKELPGESVQTGSPLQLTSLNKYTGRGNAWLSKMLPSIDSGFKQNAEMYFDTEHILWTSENQGYISDQISKCLVMPLSLISWEIWLRNQGEKTPKNCGLRKKKGNVDKWSNGLISTIYHRPHFHFTLCWENASSNQTPPPPFRSISPSTQLKHNKQKRTKDAKADIWNINGK